MRENKKNKAPLRVCACERDYGNEDATLGMNASEYVAYTDGGCKNTSVYREGGAAYLILKDGEIVKTAMKGFVKTSSNRMELLAMASAIQSIPEGADVTIVSDSKYAIGVMSGTKPAIKNIDLIRMFMYRAELMRSVKFRWVKGHNGDRYNEMVDELCTQSIASIVAKYNLPKNRFTYRKDMQFSLAY